MAAQPPPWYPLLPADTGLWNTETSSFESLAEQLLGDAGTDQDGFDSLFSALTDAVNGLEALDNSGAEAINAINSAAGILTGLQTAGIDASIAETLKAIEATSSPIGADIASLAVPAVTSALLGPPPPAPGVSVSGTGGGGVEGTAGSLGQTALEGIATGVASAVGGTLAAGGSASAAFGAAATLLSNPVTIIVGVVALIAILAEFLGKGCGEPCIESSKLEQVYEVAADIVAHAVVLGMVPFAQWANLYQAILQQGDQAFTTLKQQGDPKASAGLANMQKVLAGLAPVAPAKTQKYNWTTLLTSWLAMTNTSGWYPDSLQSGENLAETTLAQILTN